MNRISSIALLILFSIIVFGAWNCEGTGTQYGNQLPIARLANIPPPTQVTPLKNPRLTLSWVGDDPDGYVVAFKYRWSYPLTQEGRTDTLEKSWQTILNIQYGVGNAALALMLDTMYQNSEKYAPAVYKYLANLDPKVGLPAAIADGLYRGDTVLIQGVRVFASNPDSIIDQSTGLRTVKRYPVHTNPTSGTFIFDSQDSANYHQFEIRAIDNLGAVGFPATVRFTTFHVPPPTVKILQSPGDTVFVLNKLTDSWQAGVYFTFQGDDPNSRTIEYQWVVDKYLWPQDRIPWSDWSERPYANVTSKNLYDSTAVNHIFYVRARNEFGSIDTSDYYTSPVRDANQVIIGYDTLYSYAAFHTIYPYFERPGFQKRILLLNNSYEVAVQDSNAGHPTYATLNAYWRKIMDEAGVVGKYDFWQTSKNGFPTLSLLSHYSTIVFYADIVNDATSSWYKLGGNTSADTIAALWNPKAAHLISYAQMGGRMVWSARNFGLHLNVDNTVWLDIIHAQPFLSDVSSLQGADADPGFIGGIGQAGYPYAPIDTAKLDTSFHGSLSEIWSASNIGFGERIFLYDHTQDGTVMGNFLQGQIIGIRYVGITFRSIFLGLPLYYIQEPQAVQVLKQALQDVGEE